MDALLRPWRHDLTASGFSNIILRSLCFLRSGNVLHRIVFKDKILKSRMTFLTKSWQKTLFFHPSKKSSSKRKA